MEVDGREFIQSRARRPSAWRSRRRRYCHLVRIQTSFEKKKVDGPKRIGLCPNVLFRRSWSLTDYYIVEGGKREKFHLSCKQVGRGRGASQHLLFFSKQLYIYTHAPILFFYLFSLFISFWLSQTSSIIHRLRPPPLNLIY